MKRFHVRVCPISARARAMDCFSSAVDPTALPPAETSRAAMARVKSVWVTGQLDVPARTLCVSVTIAFAAFVASDTETLPDGEAAGLGLALSASVFQALASIAASTGAFLV